MERGYQVGYPVSAVLTGLAMKRFPTYKPFVWIGVVTNVIGLGIQIPARHPGSSAALVVISQAFVGFGQGMFAIASQVAITAAVSKADVATAVGSFQIMVSFGYSFSSAIVAGIWTQYLPTRLAKHITGDYDQYLAMNDPTEYIQNLDHLTKSQLVLAYSDTQWLMLIIAMCTAIPACCAIWKMQYIDLRQDQPKGKAIDDVDDTSLVSKTADVDTKEIPNDS